MNGNSLKNRLEGLSLFLILGFGHFVTLLGSAMSRFAFGVWVYQITGQVQDFATVLVAGFLPGILISPLAGVWIDRKGPRTMVLAGDLLGIAAMATVLPALLAGSFTIPHLLIVTAVLSCASALQAPAMLALIPSIVPEDKVGRANGIFSTFTSASDVAGPVLAGVLLGMGAFPVIVGFDLVTYGAAILVTLALWAKLAPNASAAAGGAHAEGQKSSWREDLKEGLHYILSNKPLLYLVVLFTLLNFGLGFNIVLVPPFVLSMGSAQDLGFVNGIFGLGMVAGGVIMSSLWKGNTRRIPLILWSCFVLGAAIAVSGLSRGLLLVGGANFLVGVMIPVVNTPVVTVLQQKTNPAYLGRVFAMVRMLCWIFLPVGQVLAGQFADRLLAANVAANDLSAGLLAAGKQGAYGLLLLGTGLFMVLAVVVFSRMRALSQLDAEGPVQEEVVA